jgi:RsiW-degrading membrane proteinase PrsW (M82 family)
LIWFETTDFVDRSASMTMAIRWVFGGLLVTAFAVSLTLLSPLFGYAYDVSEMPILWLVGALVLAGLVYFFACRNSSPTPWPAVRGRRA